MKDLLSHLVPIKASGLIYFAGKECEELLLTLLHSEWPKLHRVLAILNAIGLKSSSHISAENGNINFE